MRFVVSVIFFLGLILVFSVKFATLMPSFLQIRRSQHAVINPAITIVLRMGAGGHGAPPLRSPDGMFQ